MTFVIDSLSIRLPLNEVKILDKDIRALHLIVSEDSGEIVDTKKSNKIVKDYKGIKCKFSIEIQYNKRNFREEHLVIIVNSKMLKSRYFEGITKETISEIHKYLIEQNAVSFTLESMLNAQAVDIDFKKDFQESRGVVVKALRVMKQNAKEYKESNKGIVSFGLNEGYTGENIGLQFNTRETTSISNAPFMKIYNKTGDLITKSSNFALEFLNNVPENLWRVEFTLKNKKHLAMYQIGNTLNELLNTPSEVIDKAYMGTLRAVLNKRLRELAKSDTIPPKDLIVVNLIINGIDKGDTWGILKENVLGSLKGANRTKRAVYLQGLFDAYIKPIEAYSNYEKLDSVLEQIGYTF